MTKQRRENPVRQKTADRTDSQRKLAKQRLDERLDDALEGTFPASDPVALTPRPTLR